jgi:hypothetical protein
MEIMQAELQDRFMDNRMDAMDVLQDASLEAAKFNLNAMRGKMEVPTLEDDEVAVPIPKRLECAWDVLDRSGKKAPTKSLSVHASIQELVILAYERRNNGKAQKVEQDNEDASSEQASQADTTVALMCVEEAEEVINLGS